MRAKETEKIFTIEDSMKGKTKNSLLHLDDFPKYDLFLSQVIEFIQDLFNDESYTVNIIQNYIKSGVIAKPYHGKKKGYTKIHLIQLVFVSFMRPVLTIRSSQSLHLLQKLVLSKIRPKTYSLKFKKQL